MTDSDLQISGGGGGASIFLASKSSVGSAALRPLQVRYFSRDTSHVDVRPIKTFLHDRLRRKFFPCTGERESVQYFVENLQTASCFYRSSNHGLTQSSPQVFNYVAVTKS